MSYLINKEKVILYLMANFNYSYETAIAWINSPNANFGLSSPESLLKAGRYDKVIMFLISVKEGY